MQALVTLIKQNADWLIKRTLGYAKKRGYTKYFSTLEEAWRLSITWLSESLTAGVKHFDGIPEFGPDEDFADEVNNNFIRVQKGRFLSD